MFKIILATYFLVNIVLANSQSLNNIFGVNIDRQCEKKSEHNHVIVDSLDKIAELSLNKSFLMKYECLQNQFDETLNQMKMLYRHANLNEEPFLHPLNPHLIKRDLKVKLGKKDHKLIHQAPNYLSQVGFIFYSMSQNISLNDLRHESIKFAQPHRPSSLLNLTSNDVSLLVNEIEAYNADLEIIGAIQLSIKKAVKTRMNLLKEILKNERELSIEQKKTLMLMNAGEMFKKPSNIMEMSKIMSDMNFNLKSNIEREVKLEGKKERKKRDISKDIKKSKKSKKSQKDQKDKKDQKKSSKKK